MTEPKFLGKQHTTSITAEELEIIPTPAPGMVVTLDCSEFTSHCPVTSQPDFARVEITYEAEASIVETKSVKLWLWSFRDVRAFNERIVSDLAEGFFLAVKPRWVTVKATFNARGGISVTASRTIRS